MLDGRLMAMAPNHSKTMPVGLLGDEVPPPPREPQAVTVTLKGKDRRGRPGGGRQLSRLRRSGWCSTAPATLTAVAVPTLCCSPHGGFFRACLKARKDRRICGSMPVSTHANIKSSVNWLFSLLIHWLPWYPMGIGKWIWVQLRKVRNGGSVRSVWMPWFIQTLPNDRLSFFYLIFYLFQGF